MLLKFSISSLTRVITKTHADPPPLAMQVWLASHSGGSHIGGGGGGGPPSFPEGMSPPPVSRGATRSTGGTSSTVPSVELRSRLTSGRGRSSIGGSRVGTSVGGMKKSAKE